MSEERLQTGRVRLIKSDGSKDWPGVFFRGDNAIAISLLLEDFLTKDPDSSDMDFLRMELRVKLLDVLKTANQKAHGFEPIQEVKFVKPKT